jgi:hypothetical protein
MALYFSLILKYTLSEFRYEKSAEGYEQPFRFNRDHVFY